MPPSTQDCQPPSHHTQGWQCRPPAPPQSCPGICGSRAVSRLPPSGCLWPCLLSLSAPTHCQSRGHCGWGGRLLVLRGIQDPRLRVLLEVPLALCLAVWLCGTVPTIPTAEAGPGPSYPRPPLLLQLLGWAWSPGVPVAARARGCQDCLCDPPPSIQVKIPRKEEEEGKSSFPMATYNSSLLRL